MCIRTWPKGKDEPEHNYWVRDGQFFETLLAMAPSGTEWQKAGVGENVDAYVVQAEREAVLGLSAIQ
jgi:hypothetical protein